MADEDTDKAEVSGISDEFHEIAEGFHDLGEGTSGRLTIPGSPRLPSGQVLLRDAIRSFCAGREGKPADAVDLPRFQELIDPIRTALLDRRIKVTCLTREGRRATVSGDAFVDEKTWWAIVYAPGSIPIRPEVGIEDGHLVVLEANFSEVVGMAISNPPSLASGSLSQIPHYVRFMLEVADRLDLTDGYNFNKDFMGRAMQTIANEPTWEWLRLTPNSIEAMSRLVGDPRFADPKTGRKDRVTTQPPPGYLPKTGPDRNQGRHEDPRVPYNADYMKPKKDRPI